jgi:hypothetical protein
MEDKPYSNCARCHKEIIGATDYGRSARIPDGTYADICIDCGKELTTLQLRHNQELTEFWSKTK